MKFLLDIDCDKMPFSPRKLNNLIKNKGAMAGNVKQVWPKNSKVIKNSHSNMTDRTDDLYLNQDDVLQVSNYCTIKQPIPPSEDRTKLKYINLVTKNS